MKKIGSVEEREHKGVENFFCILDAYFYSHFLTVFIYIVSSGKKISVSQHLKMESPIEYNLCVCMLCKILDVCF